MDETRFKAWQIVRLRGWPPQWHGSAWRIAAHIYRDRAINLCEALAGYQADLHTWEDAYDGIDQERICLRKWLRDTLGIGNEEIDETIERMRASDAE